VETEITNEHRTEGKEKTCTIKLRNNQIQQIGRKINTLNKKGETKKMRVKVQHVKEINER
jgi:hypothetical protein